MTKTENRRHSETKEKQVFVFIVKRFYEGVCSDRYVKKKSKLKTSEISRTEECP